MWWSSWPSRGNAISVSVGHAGGSEALVVNQQAGGGQWNSLGAYQFSGTGSVTITAASGSAVSTCADAVWFRRAGAASEFIIDNRGGNTSRTGTWEISGAAGPYGADSVWSRDGATFTWHFAAPQTGEYEVSMWWTEWPSRSASVPVDITHANGKARVTVNQQSNGGRWNSLGVFKFTAGVNCYAMLTAGGASPTSYCADAVKFTRVAAETVIDNRDAKTSSTGRWEVSGAADFYGTDSVWSRDGAKFTWHFAPPHTGDYEVSMWWTEWPSRSTSVPVDIKHANGTTRVTANQRINGGRWNLLGVYTFTSGTEGAITLTAAGAAPTSYCADAVKFTPVSGTPRPVAVIDSISPNPAAQGESVSFVGRGTGATIAAYRWTSSIDGQLSNSRTFSTSALSGGVHQISFAVQDNAGQWSEPAVQALTVSQTSIEVIIDNRDSATSRSGVWDLSAAPDPYGADSVWSRNGASFRWNFAPPESGEYKVWMWWTEWPSRSTAAPVDIVHSKGTDRVTVNQRTSGGKWNVLGVYTFQKGVQGTVTLLAGGASPISYCADAVKFTRAADPPQAGFYADKIRGPAPFTVNFVDQTTGNADKWQWDFGDGQTSSSKSPSHVYTKPGVYTVTLTASNQYGTHTARRFSYVDIKAKNTENVYVLDGYGGNDYLVPDLRKKMREMNATETTTGWMYRAADSGMTYNVHIVRDTQAAINALYEENAHVVIAGHANYGFGLVYATSKEILDQRIDGYRYVDDDRLLNYSTESVSTKVDGMKYGQAYPNWEPVFKDGTSALMPYDFGDPRGDPPYNYYLTYQLANDSTHYRVEIDGNYVERFPDSGVPAWYSSQGLKPDPKSHSQYFIRNTDTVYNRFDKTGEWVIRKAASGGYSGEGGYMGYNYQVQWPGSGSKVAKWTMVVQRAGQYRVLATWPAMSENATNARYTIRHANGSSVVLANQTAALRRNSLGVYNFNVGSTTIELNDSANGQLVADAMILRPTADAEKILRAEFSADVQSGSAPLTVNFRDRSYNYSYDYSTSIKQWNWDFGDGAVATVQNPTHTYKQAGAYTVTLRIVDTNGGEDTEKKINFIALETKPKPQAQFRSSTMQGTQNFYVSFYDQSSGDITQWSWNFGDGSSSNQRNPVHNYTKPGRYTVRLTVTGPSGSSTETEEDYIHGFTGESYTDNTFQTKPHFYQRGYSTFGKVICYAGKSSISKEKLKYSRLFHGSCGSFPYFGNILHRGVKYGKGGDVTIEHDTAVNYLEFYFKGYTEMDILGRLNQLENIHEFYNFTEKPPSMR